VSLWLLLVVGVAVGAALFVVGVHMLRPAWGDKGTRADVGVALITATVISLAVFVLQILDENRLQRDDAKRQDEVANQALRLQLEERSNMRKIDLSKQDLRNINLPGKHLEDADLSQTDLEGANLEGVHLEGATLRDAHLEGANLQDAHLDGANLEDAHLEGGTTLDRAHLADADLFGTQLTGAELYNADLSGAKAMNANFAGAVIRGWNVARLQYDGRTVFPNGKSYKCSTAPCLLPGPKSPRR
jgi:uncharacterized protein YjbI with pentapeptide repeats